MARASKANDSDVDMEPSPKKKTTSSKKKAQEEESEDGSESKAPSSIPSRPSIYTTRS